MGVIVRGLGIPLSARENFGCTWKRRGQSWEHLGAPATSLGVPRITLEQAGKIIIFTGNAAGAPGNHSYYLLCINF